jgi:AcrR family transcriptional regulator
VKTKQQVVAEFRCSEILQAARKVFSERGFRDASVDEIASAAGMAKATIYSYFPSKEGIYLGALSEGVHELADRTEHEMDLAVGIRDKVEAFVRTRLQFLQENRDFFAVYHAEFGNLIHPASLNQDFRNLYREQFDRLHALLRDAADRGELGDISAETLAVAIYESTRGLMLRRSLGWTKRGIEEQVETLMRLLWDGAGVRHQHRGPTGRLNVDR